MAKSTESDSANRSATSPKEQAKTAAETAKAGAERSGIAAPSVGDVQKARNEGVTEAIKEDAKAAYKFATDGQLPGDPPAARQFTGADAHTNMISGMLALGPDALKAAVDEKADSPLSEAQVANLLALERNGPNRTLHVKILCDRLGVKSPLEVPHAGGPAYTNDVSNISPVTRPGE
jgi:hypothetical protein